MCGLKVQKTGPSGSAATSSMPSNPASAKVTDVALNMSNLLEALIAGRYGWA